METETLSIPSTHGSLSAIIHYPEKETGKLALLCPGFLDTKDYRHLTVLAEDLCERGYTAVRFDPTGTWESEGDIADYTTTQYLEDIKNVLEHMLSQGIYRHILLGGHSRGGQVSILYAARDPRISLVVGIMPSSGPIGESRRAEWETAGLHISKRDLPHNKAERREFRVPFEHVLDRDRYDAVSDIAKIQSPLILIAGALDTLVTPEDVEKLFTNAEEPKRFEILDGIGHDYRRDEKEIHVVNKTVIKLLGEVSPQ